MTRVASRAENGDELAVARIVMNMSRVQMRVLSSAFVRSDGQQAPVEFRDIDAILHRSTFAARGGSALQSIMLNLAERTSSISSGASFRSTLHLPTFDGLRLRHSRKTCYSCNRFCKRSGSNVISGSDAKANRICAKSGYGRQTVDSFAELAS